MSFCNLLPDTYLTSRIIVAQIRLIMMLCGRAIFLSDLYQSILWKLNFNLEVHSLGA